MEHLGRFVAHDDWKTLRRTHLSILVEPVLSERGWPLEELVARVAQGNHLEPMMA